ncbi:hypothetical protein A1353_19130 [Methylomonas methanica]|uniref:Uncharacterized protein n=1 Tax=Methylomonas methanica TaxID=421 RepID=A0A177M5F9_METMH|nr:hypothetical protein [Methylomonas methanica]OAI00922.1 hypothetical protein A1353_19130 [Methylomonas methanica]
MNPEQEKERQKNQQEFRAILEKYGITQKQAAELITTETFKTVNVRAVRAWLARADASTATPCPIWAIVALKRATEKLTTVSNASTQG